MTAAHVLAALGALAALAYLPRAAAAPGGARSALKTAPAAAFALAAWTGGASPYLVFAFALSALGDLALSRDGRAAFLYGLCSFGLAHLLFVIAFSDASGAPLWEAFSRNPLAAAALILLALSTELWLAPHAGRLAWPVRGYVALITLMGLAALTLPAQLWVALAGAALFLASDLVLAVRLFRLPCGHPAEPRLARVTWVLYIAGQGLILAGLGGV